MYSIQKLPHHIVKEVYQALDPDTLIELAPYMGETRFLAQNLARDEINQRILPFHQSLPPRLQRKVNKVDLYRFSKEPPSSALVTYMENQKHLSIDELNALAFVCYQILKQREAPNAPLNNIPQINEQFLLDMDRDIFALHFDCEKAYHYWGLQISLLCLSVIFTWYLPRIPTDLSPPIIFLCGAFYVISTLISRHKFKNEASMLHSIVKNMNSDPSSAADQQYKCWLEFLYQEMTTDQHKLLTLPHSNRRDALREKSEAHARMGDRISNLHTIFFFMIPFGFAQFITTTLFSFVAMTMYRHHAKYGTTRLESAPTPSLWMLFDLLVVLPLFYMNAVSFSPEEEWNYLPTDDNLLKSYQFSAIILAQTMLYLGSQELASSAKTWLPALKRTCLGEHPREGHQQLPQIRERRDMSKLKQT